MNQEIAIAGVPAPERQGEPKRFNVIDNGGYPFQVVVYGLVGEPEVTGNKCTFIDVLLYDDVATDAASEAMGGIWVDSLFKPEPILSFKSPIKVFIGKSLLDTITVVSGNHGSAHDGNSVLINTNGNEYIQIGVCVAKFTTTSPIMEYYSSIDKSNVAYRYATDAVGRTYLLDMYGEDTETDIIVAHKYAQKTMNNNIKHHPFDVFGGKVQMPKGFEGITSIFRKEDTDYDDDENWTEAWGSDIEDLVPDSEDWVPMSLYWEVDPTETFTRISGYRITKNGVTTEPTLAEHVALNTRIGVAMEMESFPCEVIVKRLWYWELSYPINYYANCTARSKSKPTIQGMQCLVQLFGDKPKSEGLFIQS